MSASCIVLTSMLITSPLNLGPGQCAYGDSTNTVLTVDATFDRTAPGVIIMTDGGDRLNAPTLSNVHIQFAQPSDQGSRAAFRPLGTCTSGTGGTGCKYPPAVYVPPGQHGGERIFNVTIGNAWDGITNLSATGFTADQIGIASLHAGITLANGHDFANITNYEHHNQYGLCGHPSGGNACALYTGIYLDGGVYGAIISHGDGSIYDNWRMWRSRVLLTADFSWGSFSNLQLDGDNSDLEVVATNADAAGVQVHGGYATGHSEGTNSHCQVTFGAGVNRADIEGFDIANGSTGAGLAGICIYGGTVAINGGVMSGQNYPLINVAGGYAVINGVAFINPKVPPIAIGPNGGATVTGTH